MQKTGGRKDLIESFFNYAAVEKLNPTRAQFGLAQAHVAHLYGERENLTIDRWRERRDRLRADPTADFDTCLLYTSPSPRDGLLSRMPSSA